MLYNCSKKSYEQALSMGILTQDKIGPNLSNKKGAVKTVPWFACLDSFTLL